MFYHPHDTRFTIITKHLVVLSAFLTMIAVATYAILDDTKIPQREISLVIDVKDSVNICVPEDEKFAQNSFFNF